ncbi:hypothetical protein NHQ30_002286 [Ciborinia camelliae]|nr:hypothetical protein NHQ30_002286 [Ciborinia camelliae]
MVQINTPASDSQNPITSPRFAGGMTAAQLERALQITPRMTRFKRSRVHLQALGTSDSCTAKGEIITGAPGAGDEVVMASKSTDFIHPPSRVDIPLPKQREGTLPKRFLRTIAKRKQLRREKRNESKLATSLSVEETLNAPISGENASEHTTRSSRESGGEDKVDAPAIRPEPPNLDIPDDSQESTSLEEMIQTAPRTSNSQILNDSGADYISLSFGPSRLVRRADVDPDDENSDDDEKLTNLDTDILDLADGGDSSEHMLGPDDSKDVGVGHKPQNSRQRNQKKKKQKEKKRPRRLPVNELCLVSERVREMSPEKDDENGQSSVELLDDPISQDASDALQVIETVGLTKRERKKPLQTWSYGAFGKIDNRAYRFPTLHNTSLQAEANNSLKVSPSHSDGFVGCEANPTGQYMPVAKQKRISVTIWGLTTRVEQLDLAYEKSYGLVNKPNGQAKKKAPTKKPKRPLNISIPVLVEGESEAGETDQDQQTDPENQDHQYHQDKQDDRPMHEHLPGNEIPLNMENNSPPPMKSTVSRKVTFDERVQVDQRARIASTESQTFGRCPNAMERHTSFDSQIGREMEMVVLKRCHREDGEEDGSSTDESGRSIISMPSDNDEAEESDENSEDSNEEMDEEQERGEDFDIQMQQEEHMDNRSDITNISGEEEPSEFSENSDEEMSDENEKNEDEREGCSDAQAALEEQADSRIDATRISPEERLSEVVGEQSNEEGVSEESMHNYEEAVLDGNVGDGGDATRITTVEESNQRRESCAGPFEFLIPDENQLTDADANQEDNDSQPSQLSITISRKDTQDVMATPEADTWRPRKPKSSSVMNETEEEIIDSPSPVLTIARRKSSGLHIRRRRTFRGRPLALTTSKPCRSPSPEIPETQTLVPEIPETQFVGNRDGSPELGTSQKSDRSNPFQNSIPGAGALLLDGDGEFSPHSSQLSFVPDDIREDSYFLRAPRSIMESFHTPKSRAKSTPGHFHPEYAQEVATLASTQPSIGDASSLAFETKVSPKFSQLSYAPTPRSEKSLSVITRKASFALGTLPASARRKRAKTLAFIPPFKKAKLGI